MRSISSAKKCYTTATILKAEAKLKAKGCVEYKECHDTAPKEPVDGPHTWILLNKNDDYQESTTFIPIKMMRFWWYKMLRGINWDSHLVLQFLFSPPCNYTSTLCSSRLKCHRPICKYLILNKINMPRMLEVSENFHLVSEFKSNWHHNPKA